MAGLEDLFLSPTKAPPPRSPPSPSLSPPPSRRTKDKTNDNPLFFSPGASEFGYGHGIDNGSPSSLRSHPREGRNRIRSISPSLAALANPSAAQPNPVQRNRPNRIDPVIPERAESGQRTYFTHQLGDFEDPFAALNANINDDDDEDNQGGKKKRKMAKVDADRLTSDRGIPALCRAAKKFKVKGKGYETQDLRNLLNMYQMWAHGMFPKGDFQHTINRVEVICRTKRMESALKGYRDAFYPPPASPSPPPMSDRGLTPPLSSQQDEEGPNPEPLFAARPAEEEGLDPDLEEMMAFEEMEREAGTQTHQHPSKEINGDEPPVLEEEDEWEGLYD
ncbi:uncharacterized protein IL334_001777 [Kwoniella shivajii]|uniref:Chromosome segregation in meiosis protein n=1 Tax=Kwoniella shivajii TaxID=564305 RepID=A0ABZ1CSW5_9TREE|nr:hypothetical protein IL334_001777 [Kwoniella shivajii]